MSKWKFPLSSPEIGDEEIEAVVEVLKSKWLTMGKKTREFEEKFSSRCNSKYGIAVSSCTAALHLSLLVNGIGRGDEVICPALTYVATANAITNTGAKPVFADSISSEDLTIDPEEIERKITSETKAVIPVHFAGHLCQMEKIREIAERNNLLIIEDCAHAPFASSGDKYAGSFGITGCFSFYSVKNMTCGEGGMIITDEKEIYERLKLLRTHGVTKSAHERDISGDFGYDSILPGYNYNIDEIRAAIALVQLKKIDILNEKRRKIFNSYKNELKEYDKIIFPFLKREISKSVPHILPVIIKNDFEKFVNRMFKSNIQLGRHYDLIPQLSYYRDENYKSKIEGIENIASLPFYPSLQPEDIKYICNRIKEILK